MAQRSIQALLKKHGIRPKKGLGQNFLSELPTIEKIVGAIGPSKRDCVIEIGPGPGIMTSSIAEKAALIVAIEKDAKMLEVAREEYADFTNIRWIEGDVLEIDLEDTIRNAAKETGSERVIVAGNLPYNISSPILFRLLDCRDLISRAVVMVQKEVALRIAARPGGKDYGVLSVQLQAYGSARRLFDVSRGNFIPPPDVTSSIIEIDFTAQDAVRPKDGKAFRELVRAAFGQRRKTLRNSLLGSSLELGSETLDAALEESGIDGKRRPETLTIAEFSDLSLKLHAS